MSGWRRISIVRNITHLAVRGIRFERPGVGAVSLAGKKHACKIPALNGPKCAQNGPFLDCFYQALAQAGRLT